MKIETNRIRCPQLQEKIISAEDAAAMIEHGNILGVSGFSPSGYPKAIPLALAEKIKQSPTPLQVDILAGASTGDELDMALAAVNGIRRRMPYQTCTVCRKSLNTPGGIAYQDQHLSLSPQNTRYGFYGDVDFAIIEACAITEEGGIVPTTSLGNSPTYVQVAKKVLIEINTSQPVELEGLHDVYVPLDPPNRQPIPVLAATDRIGTTYIPCDPAKIAGIVFTDIPDNVRPLAPLDDTSRAMARNLIDFFHSEVTAGRLPRNLLPLQSGIGNVANAVLAGLLESDFTDLEFYSEVIQDAALDMVEAGKFTLCSGTALTPSAEWLQKFYTKLPELKKTIMLRPQEISNHPEVVRRLGIIAMNTAIETDIYGNVNSTHVMGTRMMNGIGGSGDYARNAYLTIFLTASTAKDGAISSIVPMCSHVDHTEHDVDIIVTEQGVADLRNKCPRERALEIINHCSHPDYRPMLLDYYERALAATANGKGHTPHILSEALSWHTRFMETGTMKK
ncbi:MAG: acetyl-CoA hydrolase/transferase family protein [Peptococcaceae bacterium]|nr:acetyl-CoA hydrolase/transferase family protein [Peptococcaceae bacterium]